MALLRWSREDSKAADAAPARARAGLEAKFLREADPDGTLDPAERAVRAERIRRAYFAELTRKSIRARRARGVTRTT
jgi:hypothetical protein